MERKTKIGLIVGGSIIGAGIIALIVNKLVKNKKERGIQEAIDEARAELDKITSGVSTDGESIEAPDCSSPSRFVPTRDIAKNITNSLSDMLNRKIRPAQKSTDPEKGHNYASGYAWLRTSPEVNNAQGYLIDFNVDNKIMKVTGGIGTVVAESWDNQNPAQRWFKVKYSGSKTGWVRSDNVTFTGYDKGYSTECHTYFHCLNKPDANISATLKTTLNNKKQNNWSNYKKVCKGVGVKLGQSSFDGNNIIEKYDSSYQLGAQVFPHSNWQENNYIEVGKTRFENDLLDDI